MKKVYRVWKRTRYSPWEPAHETPLTLQEAESYVKQLSKGAAELKFEITNGNELPLVMEW